MTSYEVLKELAKREKQRGNAAMALQDTSVAEVICFIDLCKMDDELDELTMWADDLEVRLDHLCDTTCEHNKFMRALFPEDELVQWG